MTLADCDTQHSSSDWLNEAVPKSRPFGLHPATKFWTNYRRSPARSIMSWPMAQGATPRPAGRFCCADLAIVPCKASMLEVRASNQATSALRMPARSARPTSGHHRCLAWSARYRLTKDMQDVAAGLRLPVAKTSLTLRQVYADAPGQGAVVWHFSARAREASRQIQQLCRELVPEANKLAKSKRSRPDRFAQVKPTKTATALGEAA